MNKQWILYASIVTGIIFIVLYVSISSNIVSVHVLLNTAIVANNISYGLGYGRVMNGLSQQVVGNTTYEDTVEWMLRSDLGPEENITLQGYALGWDFYEEQTCAARNLVGLQRWATSLDFGVVEPFVFQSYFRMGHFRDNNSLRLSDYFDIDVWNHKVVTTVPHGTPFVKWEDFIRKAARQLIVVHVMMGSSEGTKVYMDDEVKKGTCSSPRSFTTSTLKEFGFEVVRQVCFKFSARSPLQIDEFNKNILGPFKANNVSIVFPFVPGVIRARINILEGRYHQNFVDWLKPSERVKDDAKRYARIYLDTNYAAISLRITKIGISLRSRKPADIRQATKVVVDKCLDKMKEILSSIPGQHFMAVDIGRYGDPKSLSFVSRDVSIAIINKMINVTYNHNSWQKEEWENTFIEATNGITDRGYIASVQKEIASHANVVIAAGGGSFQSSMLLQHKSQTTQKHDVFQACSISELYEAYKSMNQ